MTYGSTGFNFAFKWVNLYSPTGVLVADLAHEELGGARGVAVQVDPFESNV
jgi:hypothetical protein